MVVVGLSSYSHDASCAIIRDGKLVAMAEEERFDRQKHSSNFPFQALQYCLRESGLSVEAVDEFAFFWNPNLEIVGNLSHFLQYFPNSLNIIRAESGGSGLGAIARMRSMKNVARAIQEKFQMKHRPCVRFYEHHLCHAASAFYVSPFESAAILTIDGRGEHVTTLMGEAKGQEIRKVKEVSVPHSLGHFYAAITEYLGFKPFFDEWKVMGLSAYGNDSFVRDFASLISLNADGSFLLNLDYFSFHTHGSKRWLSEKFFKKFGPPIKDLSLEKNRAANIAFALQRTIEKAGVHLAQSLYRITRQENLCMTGGVVLNCLMNRKIIESTPFKNVFIQPIANDAGASLGAALYSYHSLHRGERSFAFFHPYWGPEYSNDEIERALRLAGLDYTKVENIAASAAKEIAAGKIVGWFQGRMECGPRALGNRSIVVDPTRSEMKAILNSRVKRRESFRPFAPSVLAERASEYFSLPKNQDSPFMILIGDVREEVRPLVPAVTHVDGTARVHTVQWEANPKYWELIKEFEKIRGVPLLLNTSFNENEPIVCTPEDAINCYRRTEFDVLAIGDFLVKKT